jgi:hypothetical protein
MAQIFSPGADTWLRLTLLAIAVAVVVAFLLVGGFVSSDWRTNVNFHPGQPVPFSHEHHVGGLGLDCRYCHAAVEVSRHAGFPPTHTCMTCHSQLYTDAAMLAPVRQSLATGTPLRWSRIAKLPDYVYFDHSVHIAKGVGCSTCHGPMQKMPLAYTAKALVMGFCIDCHRDPAPYLRADRTEVFDMDWSPPPNQRELGARRMVERGIAGRDITHCYTCHR